ncbi:interferon regulatory factor 5 isoform X1 [Hydra vulgaris]|uniref:interferon regulatory factor 5 isoform X1 n=2 Tax=Hydra vulgaris TaxID=6087 RepID=UPI001F5F9D3D|nr:interferon regulatory factor 5 isoform X1 [Hydra vulgaris]
MLGPQTQELCRDMSVMEPNDDFDVTNLLPDDCSESSEFLRNQLPKKQKLKPWLLDQINSGKYPGLDWIDKSNQIFKIPWKHFGRPGEYDSNYAMLFRAWAVHTNRFNESKPEDVSRWKTNLRCALDRQPEIKRVPDYEFEDELPYRAYQFTFSDKKVASPTSLTSNTTSGCDSTCNSPASLLGVDIGGSYISNDMHPSNSIDDLNLQELLDEGIGYDSSDFQSLTLPDMTAPLQEQSLLVKLFYGEQEFYRKLVNNPNGLRIAFNPPTLLPENIIPEETSKLRSIFGPEKADQIYFPPIPNVMIMKILENMPRGLVLQERDGCIYATRLCRARVFYSSLIPPTLGTNQLLREHTTSVFDYTGDFLPRLSLFTQGGGSMPTAEIYFSFGQTWSQDRPLKNNFVYISITHCLAHQRLSEIQNLGTEIQASEPNSNDLIAQHFAGLSISQNF